MCRIEAPVPYWQAFSEDIAVRWEFDADGIAQPTAMLMYRTVAFHSMRSIALRNLLPDVPGRPVFGSEPPTEAALNEAWHDPRNREMRDAFAVTTAFDRRRDGESARDFYARVAATYTALMTTSQAPTLALAAAAGVPKTTAARWIRESRLRGLLAQPINRGQERVA